MLPCRLCMGLLFLGVPGRGPELIDQGFQGPAANNQAWDDTVEQCRGSQPMANSRWIWIPNRILMPKDISLRREYWIPYRPLAWAPKTTTLVKQPEYRYS